MARTRGRTRVSQALAQRSAIRPFLIAVAILVVWELVTRSRLINPLIVAPPSLIARAAWTDGASFLEALETTLGEILLSIIVTWPLGVIIGAFVAFNRLLSEISIPLLSAIIAIPLVVLYPLLVVWVGVGPESKVAFGCLAGFFPITLNTLIGIRSVDWDYEKMASSFGATRRQVAFQVLIPLALPYVISGLRIGTSLIIISVIIGEMLSSLSGLGFLISMNRALFNTGQVYLGIGLALGIAVIVDVCLGKLERRTRGDSSVVSTA